MRVLFTTALLVFGPTGVTTAGAADIAIERSGNYSGGYGQRAEQFVIYDYQPGVLVRAYWGAPWRHHHYFPATGKPPGIGRVEDLSAPSGPLKPAKTFRRSWSNASAFEHEVPAPRNERSEPNPGPLK